MVVGRYADLLADALTNVGVVVEVPWPTREVEPPAWVRGMVVDAAVQYGRITLLVQLEPPTGDGRVWVRTWRYVAEEGTVGS